MRGISLPVETTVVVVLAVIVLVALLFFFSGTFLPGADRIKLEQKKVDLCTRYVSQDSECRGSGPSDLLDVCAKLDIGNARACCIDYCPRIETQKQCESVRGKCLRVSCDDKDARLLGYKGRIGSCNDFSDNPICCSS